MVSYPRLAAGTYPAAAMLTTRHNFLFDAKYALKLWRVFCRPLKTRNSRQQTISKFYIDSNTAFFFLSNPIIICVCEICTPIVPNIKFLSLSFDISWGEKIIGDKSRITSRKTLSKVVTKLQESKTQKIQTRFKV